MSRLRLALVLLALLAVPLDAVAETQSLARLPTKTPGRVGFALDVSAEAMGRAGYRPVHLQFTSLTGTFPKDRAIAVLLSPRIYPSVPHEFDFTATVRLPQGAASVKRTVYVPLYYRWQWFRVRAYEDGQLIEGCDTADTTIATPNQGGANVAWTNVGLVLSDTRSMEVPWQRVPDTRTLTAALGKGPLPENVNKGRLANDEALQTLYGMQDSWVQFHPLPQAELSENWLAYSQLDVVTVAQPVLEQIRSAQPAAAEALCRWVASGGNLWVYGVDDSRDPLLAGTSPMDPASVPDVPSLTNSLELNQQNGVEAASYVPYGTIQPARSGKLRKEIYEELKASGHEFARSEPADQVAKRISSRDVAAGRVVYLRIEDPFPGSYQFWRSVVVAAYPPRLTWHIRSGVDVHEANDDYWALLIAAVGRPPVMAFLALITGFVLLVGPVAYHLLSRARRLYLLFFVAPVAALLVTVGLFLYGVLADGLGTQVRPRQITVIDGPTGTSVEAHRQTYFAGSASDRGLVFPADVAVYPIFEDPLRDAHYPTYGGSRPATSRVINEGDHVRYGGRLFASRTQHQFLVHHPDTDLGKLQLIQSPDGTRVANALPFVVTELLVRDGEGGFWLATERLEPGASAVALPQEMGEADAWLLKRRVRTALEVPEVYESITEGDLFGLTRRYNYGWGYTQQARIMEVGRAPQQGVLEQIIAQRFALEEELPKGSFVGFAEVSDRLIAAEGAEVTDGIHIILGTLP